MKRLAKAVERKARAFLSVLAQPRPKRYYGVGDLAPDSLMNRPDDAGPIGAFISVDPETRRITAIHHI